MKDMVIQPTVSLDKGEQTAILDNSNERIINSSVAIANYIMGRYTHFPDEIVEYAGNVIEGWEDIKGIDVKLFNAARNAILLKLQKEEK